MTTFPMPLTPSSGISNQEFGITSTSLRPRCLRPICETIFTFHTSFHIEKTPVRTLRLMLSGSFYSASMRYPSSAHTPQIGVSCPLKKQGYLV
jgi:hypothetical protein